MTTSSAPPPGAGSPDRTLSRSVGDAAAARIEQRDSLGRSIRARRETLGLSLRALAERVGISASALSHIENGRSQPSVSTLFALVRELDTSLDELFAADAAPAPGRQPAPSAGTTVVRYADARKPVELGAGIAWERLAGDEEVQFLQLTYEPGAASCLADSFVRHAGREYGLVLRGRLRITLGLQHYDLGPGDSIRFEAHLPHRLANVGNSPVEAVWVMVGRSGSPPHG